ncbi:MAG: hypothetical protein LBR10_10950, partial [Prevotellaceae bacterium]|jgi:hypothetical protein|nr:hypothetical protein [Prevotellaceae bacterium]
VWIFDLFFILFILFRLAPANDICTCRNCDGAAGNNPEAGECHYLLFIACDIPPTNDDKMNEGNVIVTSLI